MTTAMSTHITECTDCRASPCTHPASEHSCPLPSSSPSSSSSSSSTFSCEPDSRPIISTHPPTSSHWTGNPNWSMVGRRTQPTLVESSVHYSNHLPLPLNSSSTASSGFPSASLLMNMMPILIQNMTDAQMSSMHSYGAQPPHRHNLELASFTNYLLYQQQMHHQQQAFDVYANFPEVRSNPVLNASFPVDTRLTRDLNFKSVSPPSSGGGQQRGSANSRFTIDSILNLSTTLAHNDTPKQSNSGQAFSLVVPTPTRIRPRSHPIDSPIKLEQNSDESDSVDSDDTSTRRKSKLFPPHHSSSSPPPTKALAVSPYKKRKSLNRGPRIPFTGSQVSELEAKFSATQYLSSLEVSQLAKQLNLTDTRVSAITHVFPSQLLVIDGHLIGG